MLRLAGEDTLLALPLPCGNEGASSAGRLGRCGGGPPDGITADGGLGEWSALGHGWKAS